MERKEELKFGGAAVSLPADLSFMQGGGGAEGEAALATLEKQLICPICLELFNKPVVILPCQHNLCRKCANELYQPSLFQPRTTMMLSSGRFRCPTCRHEVVLDRHGVYGLPRNLLVENIIDVYKQEVSNFNNKVASALLSPPLPAQLTCSDHEGEKVNIYCLTCKVPTCSLCKVFGAHQSCQVAPLTDIYQLQKDELSEEVRSLREYNDQVQALIDNIEQTCRNVEENSKTQKQSVCEQFDQVLSILDERRKAMTERITSEQEEKTGHAQALIRCYGDSMEANKELVERAVSSMEEPDLAAFVQSSRELITKVMAAAGFCPAETLKPGYESLSHYSFNFSRQERALRGIDFPKAVEDVPEEPAPEDTKPILIQNAEPKHPRETPIQNLEDPQRDSAEELTGAVLQTETHRPDDGGSGVMMNKKEEEEEKEKEEAEKRCAAPEPVKEEGMTTLQCDGGEAESGDLTAQSQTVEEEPKQEISSPQPAGDSPPESKPQTPQRVDFWIQEWSTYYLDLPPPRSQEIQGDAEEEEDVQGRGCPPGAVDESLSLTEEICDPGLKTILAEGTQSEDAEEKKHLKEEGPKCAPGLKEIGDLKAEITDEELQKETKTPKSDSAARTDEVLMRKDGSKPQNDSLKPERSGFPEKKEVDAENTKSEDLKSKYSDSLQVSAVESYLQHHLHPGFRALR
ncbi:tripartite motif-containing protein 54-like [Xyrichtys novacula]|uniref:RING-type E3 ubiquitin transferase n=1 Tax=Xyrichtys novacula TaxID=13765 RepID=A0AAV1HEX8_XYRNO|nr:tripartite motif-containing protein 54-like [Xyrichtys novacula]